MMAAAGPLSCSELTQHPLIVLGLCLGKEVFGDCTARLLAGQDRVHCGGMDGWQRSAELLIAVS